MLAILAWRGQPQTLKQVIPNKPNQFKEDITTQFWNKHRMCNLAVLIDYVFDMMWFIVWLGFGFPPNHRPGVVDLMPSTFQTVQLFSWKHWLLPMLTRWQVSLKVWGVVVKQFRLVRFDCWVSAVQCSVRLFPMFVFWFVSIAPSPQYVCHPNQWTCEEIL